MKIEDFDKEIEEIKKTEAVSVLKEFELRQINELIFTLDKLRISLK